MTPELIYDCVDHLLHWWAGTPAIKGLRVVRHADDVWHIRYQSDLNRSPSYLLQPEEEILAIIQIVQDTNGTDWLVRHGVASQRLPKVAIGLDLRPVLFLLAGATARILQTRSESLDAWFTVFPNTDNGGYRYLHEQTDTQVFFRLWHVSIVKDTGTVDHKESGLVLWMDLGGEFFSLYWVKGNPMDCPQHGGFVCPCNTNRVSDVYHAQTLMELFLALNEAVTNPPC